MIDGFALIDKDQGWTSHDVVARLRRLYGQKRVGHAGTLDPMATGVLIVGLGHATRLLRFVQGEDKTYAATIRLGQSTVTDDAQGEITSTPGWEWDPAGLSGAITGLTGAIQQVPSAVSAIKVDGVRSYAKVRKGQQVELEPRPVMVSEFEMVGAPRMPEDLPCVDIDVLVTCSSGTYVRALARDLGCALQSAGHLTALRRTAIGGIGVDRCHRLGAEAPPVTSIVDVMSGILPVMSVDPDAAQDLRHGRPIEVEASGVTFAVAADDGRALCVLECAGGQGRVAVNLPSGH